MVMSSEEVREFVRRHSDGVIREPRVYFDTLTLPDATTKVVRSRSECFRNGEQYPVTIRALTAAILGTDDERRVQQVGIRLTYHEAQYMQRSFVQLPLWHNVCTAAPRPLSFGMSMWKFHTPFIFAAGDVMNVQAQLRASPTDRPVTFSMSGIGIDSFRPFRQTGQANLDSTRATGISPETFRNEGDEAILVTECAMQLGVTTEDPIPPSGDIRDLLLTMFQYGGGTNASWINGPDDGSLCPAVLLGRTYGHAVVHEFPGEGVTLMPGDSFTAEAQLLTTGPSEDTLGLGLIGTIEVA